MPKHTPEEIVQILHSISKLSTKDKELDTWFGNEPHASGIHSFVPESFTRQLLELIEDYLLGDEHEDQE